MPEAGWARWLGYCLLGAVAMVVFFGAAAGGRADLEEAGCWDGRYVADPGEDRGLVADCRALLAVREYWLKHPDNAGLPGDHQLRTWEAGLFWNGVTIGLTADGPRVTRLDFAWADLGGGVPAELGELTALERLYLNNNRLTGPIPAQLGGLTYLTLLQLNDNRLTGAVPEEIVRLPRLERLRLGGNQLAGPLPPEERILEAAEDEAPTAPPRPAAAPDPEGCSDGTYVFDPAADAGLAEDCRTLLSMREHWLNHPGNAGLPADHPLRTWGVGLSWDGVLLAETEQGARVDTLAFPWWNLAGGIPPEIAELDGLRRLFLNHNRLTGPIPAQLGDLTGLTQLHLNSNRLSGPVPAQMARLTGLTRLALYDNRLTGPVPAAFGQLTELVYLDFDRNRMSGPLPPELGNLTKLTSLWLRGNRFTGPLPEELGNLAELRRLHIADNRFAGPLPAALENLAPSRGGSLAVLDACRSGTVRSLPPALLRIFQNSYKGGYCDDEGHPYENAVSGLAGWGLDMGCGIPAGFCPDRPADRATVAAYLRRAATRLLGYAGTIESPGGPSNPQGRVTRGEMAVMLARAFPHLRPAAEATGQFADLPGGETARAAEALLVAGITRGCSTDPLRFCPGVLVTRGQMAHFLIWAIDSAGA